MIIKAYNAGLLWLAVGINVEQENRVIHRMPWVLCFTDSCHRRIEVQDTIHLILWVLVWLIVVLYSKAKNCTSLCLNQANFCYSIQVHADHWF